MHFWNKGCEKEETRRNYFWLHSCLMWLLFTNMFTRSTTCTRLFHFILSFLSYISFLWLSSYGKEVIIGQLNGGRPYREKPAGRIRRILQGSYYVFSMWISIPFRDLQIQSTYNLGGKLKYNLNAGFTPLLNQKTQLNIICFNKNPISLGNWDGKVWNSIHMQSLEK